MSGASQGRLERLSSFASGLAVDLTCHGVCLHFLLILRESIATSRARRCRTSGKLAQKDTDGGIMESDGKAIGDVDIENVVDLQLPSPVPDPPC